MYLLIDYREKDFINKLSEFVIIENDIVKTVTINNINIKFKITCLEIGDYIIQESLDQIDSILLCIERKSISDLCASIKDSRFREQKVRLIESLKNPEKICYLIEKNIKKSYNNLPQNIINGAILNLIFKHNYKVINTNDNVDTFNNILLLYKKFQNNDFPIRVFDINNEYDKSYDKSYDINKSIVKSKIKLIKRSEKIENEKMINQLCLISGVSIIIAESIIENIQTVICNNIPITIKILIEIYNKLETESEKELLFSDVLIKGKTRKIGKALSKKIYEYFCI
jgi:ERCC4-type nuclease